MIVLAAPAASEPVAAPDQVALRGFLSKLYKTYQSNDLRQGWGQVIGEKSIFTSSTLNLLIENRRLLKGEMGAIEADIFCACQDHGPSFRLVSVTFKPLPAQRVNAAVVIKNFDLQTLNIQFEKTATGWRVYDINLPQQGMLRKMLIDENAELRDGIK
jgi:hypothetical protein